MKPIWGILALAFVVAAATWPAGAQSPGSAAAGSGTELITHLLPVEGQPTQLTLIDPARRVLAVYHITRDSGEIHLKSVRNIQGDLQLEEFNGVPPLPKEILNMIRRTP
ncbi:MAG: hypothetical protein KF688_17605 [Pirellulales bacterium]|nr:hypothetical protein [Pirellulales bacterium]MBX3433329.1 hypothetical protein [Pirellulales bacterium]